MSPLGLRKLIRGASSTMPAPDRDVEPYELPVTLIHGDRRLTLRTVESSDLDAVSDFVRALPAHDLLFLRRDLTDLSEIEQWIAESVEGRQTTILAIEDGRVIGYVVVDPERVSWGRHVAEIRALISASWRGRGLGRLLVTQAFAVAKQQGYLKIVAQMTVDQEAARRSFARLGFRHEATLTGHVMDGDGQLHDLVVMSLRVGDFRPVLNDLMALAEEQRRRLG